MPKNPFAPASFKQQDPKFYTKAGWLTWYSLACGYIEKKRRDGIETTLWHEGGPTLHVRQHDFNTGRRVFWDCFEITQLNLARLRYLNA